MTRLRTLCDTHSIRLVEDHEHPYERGFLCAPLLKIVVVFDNATEQDTELLIKTIMEYWPSESVGVVSELNGGVA